MAYRHRWYAGLILRFSVRPAQNTAGERRARGVSPRPCCRWAGARSGGAGPGRCRCRCSGGPRPRRCRGRHAVAWQRRRAGRGGAGRAPEPPEGPLWARGVRWRPAGPVCGPWERLRGQSSGISERQQLGRKTKRPLKAPKEGASVLWEEINGDLCGFGARIAFGVWLLPAHCTWLLTAARLCVWICCSIQDAERGNSGRALRLKSCAQASSAAVCSQITLQTVGFISMGSQMASPNGFLGQGMYCTLCTLPNRMDVGCDLKVLLETNNNDGKLLLFLV